MTKKNTKKTKTPIEKLSDEYTFGGVEYSISKIQEGVRQVLYSFFDKYLGKYLKCPRDSAAKDRATRVSRVILQELCKTDIIKVKDITKKVSVNEEDVKRSLKELKRIGLISGDNSEIYFDSRFDGGKGDSFMEAFANYVYNIK